MDKVEVPERPVYFIDSKEGLNRLWSALDAAHWFGFDTEFIGEKREIPLLCLLQVVTEEGVWLVDTLHAGDWSHFGEYLQDPSKLILTHAGENDYRLMVQLLNVYPKNTYDLQLAAGFVGMRYPSSLGSILQNILNVNAGKGFTVADWTIRPLPEKMVTYAVEDVRYLDSIYRVIGQRLVALGRENWVAEEMKRWEDPDFYKVDYLKKLLQQKSIASYTEREKIFILRLAQWRQQESIDQSLKAEEILSSRQLLEMARIISSGTEALFRSRILPKAFIRNHKESLYNWYNEIPTSTELAQLYMYAPKDSVDPGVESRTQMVLLLLQVYCIERELSIDLLLPGSEPKKYRIFNDYRYDQLYSGWRYEFLPDIWRDLLENRSLLTLSLEEKGILLTHP